MTTHRQTYHHP